MLKQRSAVFNDDGVLLCGYYKKLKTMKKKFFVLFNETPCNVARIEYYDNEKKYKSGFNPKRVIKIKNCFNINTRLYTKHDFVIVLASREGGFGIVMDSEEEMNIWLNQLLQLQRLGGTCVEFPNFGSNGVNNGVSMRKCPVTRSRSFGLMLAGLKNLEFRYISYKLTYFLDYVWQVVIQKKGAAEQHNIFGNYHICLTNKCVTFIKIGREKNQGDKKCTKIDILLTTIRRCGDSQCYFYMEIGRQSSLGPGELWMETEDSLTAQNMHKMIISKMISLNEATIEPMRKRSSSATEATNLDSVRKSLQNVDASNNFLFSENNFIRDRCDSLPSRNRSSSESCNHSFRVLPMSSTILINNSLINNTSNVPFSASEESVSVDESEDSIGVPYLISSRSSERVIPEESIDEGFALKKTNDNVSLSVGKTQINVMKQCGAVKTTDKLQDVCGNLDNQLHCPVRAYSFGSKGENNLTKDALVNRVRAFSVGSRMKCSCICTKANPKSFNSDNIKQEFVESSTRKSISVPVLINKNIQTIDQMSHLMEIDFSKPLDKNVKKNNQPKTISNSVKSVHKNTKAFDKGYLEMKPLTLIPSNTASHTEQKDIIDNTNLAHKILKENCETISESISSTLSYSLPSSRSINDECERNVDTSFKNQDLHYASLDLPKCDNAVNTRYEFKQTLSEINIEEIKNEYAKIKFDQPEASCSLRQKKYQ
ncbi:insulin receptor substrate 1 chico isoform 2-T13 [Cochliomyia hominivorax]